MEFVTVIKPGFLTTVQDLGRRHYRIFGVSVSGVMDSVSFRLANILVGNDLNEAALEVTLVGPRLQFNASSVIAITGADLTPLLNGQPIQMWKALKVQKGDELHFGGCQYGARSYIAFAGGVQVPMVMGSRSTYVRGEYGGIDGRPLKAGDEIPIGTSRFQFSQLHGRRIRPTDLPEFERERPIQFILGPDHQEFTEQSIETFIHSPYIVTNDSDRMGYRLQGAQLEHINGADIISDFITIGTIQVPGSGQPIVHMADCGTSGGYTKLGVVIGADIPYLAQRKPGDRICFEPVEIEEAQEKWKFQEQLISQLELSANFIPIR
ncbi:biotin-dependent carboxyltransferase family protein [Bacillus salipaludis]|uniref:Biotin-dependent carboxyltransferase family protein n=1 Tax=Bacillus salipaludis TaxID=2547811 RepID=A0ABW8RM46_9BACI